MELESKEGEGIVKLEKKVGVKVWRVLLVVMRMWVFIGSERGVLGGFWIEE